jgi:hypothetical protein
MFIINSEREEAGEANPSKWKNEKQEEEKNWKEYVIETFVA